MKNWILILIFACVVTVSCQKGKEMTPEFSVTTESFVVKAGAPVTFYISGDADMVSFFSGEPGNEYAYSQKDRIEETELAVSFTTQSAAGTPGHPNPAEVPILYSCNFAPAGEEYTVEDVLKADWTDISDRFDMPTDLDQTIPSGTVNIDDLFVDYETPLYLMFHYQVEAFDETLYGGLGNGRTSYSIQSFKVDGISSAGSTTVYPFADCHWTIVKTSSYDDNRRQDPDVNTTRILLRSEFEPLSDKECYAIGGPFYRQEALNTGHDLATGIKSLAEPMPATYTHTYDTPGTYTVTFVARNTSVYGKKEVVESIEVRVVEDAGSILPPEIEEWND